VFVGFSICASRTLRDERARQYRVGDLVEVVALPDYAFQHHNNADLKRHAALLRHCLGKRFPIVYIGDDGRPELDVSAVAAPLMGCIGCEISIEAQCISIV
jgi:hypothetical protein